MTFKIVSKICASNHLIYELSWSTLAWKKSSDSIALIRNNLSNFKQNLPIFRLFSSSQPKMNGKAYCLMHWHMFNLLIFCETLNMSRTLKQTLNIYFQSALPIWTNFSDSIHHWHLFPLGIWCTNFKNNLKCYLISILPLEFCLYTSRLCLDYAYCQSCNATMKMDFTR